ncbi:HNH endonuclease [Azospirillum sp.]|uniref:HNH endonuclease n=1 Tax=Azospirillum sp. TaxID=34012 RepID=UPI003D750870
MAKLVDLTGRKFGRLVVTGHAHTTARRAFWNALCECGSTVVVRGSNLTTGNTLSCGCFSGDRLVEEKRENMEGKRFGRLVVTSYSHTSEGRKAFWYCVCDCGGSSVVSGDQLRRGRTLSCGCLRTEATSSRCKSNIAGRKFGMLTVLREFGRNARSQTTWLCRCECGNEKVLDGCVLRGGITVTCGCRAGIKSPLRSVAVREAMAPHRSKRRARIRGAGGSFTKGQVEELYSRQRGRCAGCGERLRRSYHRDHITPLSRGGRNDISNIQLLCQTCNQSKHAKDPVTWARSMGRLI